MKLTTCALAFACVLAHLGLVQAVCCRASLTLSYAVANGNCADAGGRLGSNGCTITICADGKAQQGTYCGRGSCNIFGCNCDNGCITGDWKNSFLQRNLWLRPRVTEEKWNT
ncbi:Diedel [Drosophila busckii]|uniref:Diedel n=1 Tax=Drosophila busckii TaxID=30019 RepID=A0A0M4EB13_DROBS|nr:Diedel [Drosophila busckii]ALC39701.1 Diedel [Drosophila busckii]